MSRTINSQGQRRSRSDIVDLVAMYVASNYGVDKKWTAVDLRGKVPLQSGVINHMHISGLIVRTQVRPNSKSCRLHSGHVCWMLTVKGLNRAMKLGCFQGKKASA